MFAVRTLLPVEKKDVFWLKLAGRAIVSSRNSIEISVFPIGFVEKRKLPLASRYIYVRTLNDSCVDHFMVVISVVQEVRDISFEEVDAWVKRDMVKLEISEKIDDILIWRVFWISMSYNLIFIKLQIIPIHPQEVNNHRLIEFLGLSARRVYHFSFYKLVQTTIWLLFEVPLNFKTI